LRFSTRGAGFRVATFCGLLPPDVARLDRDLLFAVEPAFEPAFAVVRPDFAADAVLLPEDRAAVALPPPRFTGADALPAPAAPFFPALERLAANESCG